MKTSSFALRVMRRVSNFSHFLKAFIALRWSAGSRRVPTIIHTPLLALDVTATPFARVHLRNYENAPFYGCL